MAERRSSSAAIRPVADSIAASTGLKLGLAYGGEGYDKQLAVLEQGVSGVHHWSDAGVASWYDFAVAIAELGQASGLLADPARVHPITTADYPTPAQRPSYSLLDCTHTRAALQLPALHWRSALQEVIADVVA